MTVANQTNRISAEGTGVEQEVPFSFPYAATSDIKVYSRVTDTGVETLLEETTNYTLTAASDTGGTLTTVDPFVAAGTEIHIIRDTPKTQALDLEAGGSFSAEDLEDALDKNTKLILENKDSLDRALRAPATDAVALDLELPNSVDRASKNLGFDAGGNVTVTESDGTFAVATAVWDDVITKSPQKDVRAYGAVGDGVTDDTVAIQAAIDALGSNGGTVLFPTTGTYIVSETIYISKVDSVILRGTATRASGYTTGTILKWDGSAGGTTINLHATEMSGIENMIINANNKAAVNLHITTEAGERSSWNNHFHRIAFIGIASTANVRLGTANETDIAYNRFENCVFHHAKVNVLSDSTNAANTVLENCQLYGTAYTDYGIRLNRGHIALSHVFFAGIEVADIYVPAEADGKAVLSGVDVSSESDALILSVENVGFVAEVFFFGMRHATSGGNSIAYDSPTPLVIIGGSFSGAPNMVVGDNVVGITEISVEGLTHTGTLTNKLVQIIGNGITSNSIIYAHNGMTIGAKLIQGGTGAITATSGPGAIAVTGQIHEVTTTGAGDAMTLANGTAGQRLTIIYVAEGAGGDTAVITPVTLAGGATITLNALGDSCDLQYSSTGGWYVLGLGGTAAVA